MAIASFWDIFVGDIISVIKTWRRQKSIQFAMGKMQMAQTHFQIQGTGRIGGSPMRPARCHVIGQKPRQFPTSHLQRSAMTSRTYNFDTPSQAMEPPRMKG